MPSSSRDTVDVEKQSCDGIEKESIKSGERNQDCRRKDEEVESSNGNEDDDDDDEDDAEPSVMDRVLSRMTSRSSVAPGPPPDGGWNAWSACKS